MSVVRLPSGRWRAKLKAGRTDVASRVFNTKGEATAWLARERAALVGGVDRKAGSRRVRDVLPVWLEVRRATVAEKTYRADASLLRLVPPGVQSLQLSAVTGREVARSFVALLGTGLSERSVVRYRASLAVFFGWCVGEKMIAANPVDGVRVPRSSAEPVEMQPFTEAELEDAWSAWRARDVRLADVLLVLGWTGLRWGEARAVLVGDLMEVPTPGLLVRRSAPEGVAVKAPKGRRSRRVPVADRVLPIVRGLAEGKGPDDLLLTTARGARLHRTAVLRTLAWEQTGAGRRLHDLRHTAACLWLARGVDPGTVKAWMGHRSIATTNLYLHHLGSAADRAGLDLLNVARGASGGHTTGGRTAAGPPGARSAG